MKPRDPAGRGQHARWPSTSRSAGSVCGRGGLRRDRPSWLFTDNETNTERLYGVPNDAPYVKDAFHDTSLRAETAAVNPRTLGTKAAAHYRLEFLPGRRSRFGCGSSPRTEAPREVFGDGVRRIVADRMRGGRRILRADHARRAGTAGATGRSASVRRLALDASSSTITSSRTGSRATPTMPPPPESRKSGRNADWPHLFSRDVLSMPDKWEYPWFAAWDLAFHMIPFARVDPEFAKQQLMLLLREWYMHPNGQMPAYEFDFGDVNPPVHAWACWRVYKMTAARGAAATGGFFPAPSRSC